MRKAIRLTAFVAFVSALAHAETWTGKLVDAGCAEQQKNTACTPTDSTNSYALQSSGKLMKLDAEGNKKATAALRESQSGANRAKDPKEPTEVTATVSGTMSGDEIKVESIKVQ